MATEIIGNLGIDYRKGRCRTHKRFSDAEKTARSRLNNKDRLKLGQDLYRKEHPLKYLYALAKRKAKDRGKEFSILLEDLGNVPSVCPLLKIAIDSYGNLDGRPSIDRIDSSKGYIPGNVWIISWKANRLKNNATIQDLKLLYENLKKKLE